MEFSSAPGASSAANELVEDKRPPQGLTEATPLAPMYAPSYPDESRRGDLKNRPARRPGSADNTIWCGRAPNTPRPPSQGGPVGSSLPFP